MATACVAGRPGFLATSCGNTGSKSAIVNPPAGALGATAPNGLAIGATGCPKGSDGAAVLKRRLLEKGVVPGAGLAIEKGEAA
jgi:hypothetical protein